MTRGRWTIAAATIVLVLGLAFLDCLPDPLFDDPVSTIMLSSEGMLLAARIADDGQWRFPASDEVPSKFARAIIHFEDKRFYRHLGVDPLALARAVVLNLRGNRIVSGGSTLSMQVIRLSRKGQPRTYREKVIEVVLALRLELRHTKAEILGLYASHAPLGGNVVGLEAAGWRYFGRSPDQLSWAEVCALAVLPNRPGMIHPGRNRKELLAKRDKLLASLAEAGVIDSLDYSLALHEPIPQRPLSLPRLAPHLLDTLMKDQARVRAASSRLFTTIEHRLQRSALEVLERHGSNLALEGIRNTAAIVVDNRSFEVVAYVGNRVFDPGTRPPANEGHAIDVIRKPRSSGSILKPLLYASMLQAGEILPSTLIPDVPTQYAGYRPANFDRTFRGAVSAQLAVVQSLNVPSVRMLEKHGVGRFHSFLSRFGMSTLHRPAEEYGLTLILGGAETTVWDVAGMYANLAHIARTHDSVGPSHYRKIKVVEDRESDNATGPRSELGPAAAWLTLESLLEVRRPGVEGHWRSFSSSQPIAWKTGTSYGLRDGWAVGTTARYTVAVWVGNADGEGNSGLTGLSSAAPVLFDLFDRLERTPWFEEPTKHLREVRVCRNDGFLATNDCESKIERVPRDSHFAEISRNHPFVHLDSSERWRVNSRCQSVHDMVRRSWFVLPPLQEYYFRRTNAQYRSLPPVRADCRLADSTAAKMPIGLIYPPPRARVYIPVDLDLEREHLVFEAVHRDTDATLYWHLDDEFVSTTSRIHQLAVSPEPGWHRLTLVDAEGNRLERRFEVLGTSRGDTHSPYGSNQSGSARAPHDEERGQAAALLLPMGAENGASGLRWALQQ